MCARVLGKILFNTETSHENFNYKLVDQIALMQPLIIEVSMSFKSQGVVDVKAP